MTNGPTDQLYAVHPYVPLIPSGLGDNKAFSTMKEENQPRLHNIECALYNAGMGDIMLKPGIGEQSYRDYKMY